MKVRELLSALEKHRPELDVICITEEDELLAPGHLFRLLDIESVETIEAEKVRGDGHLPSLKIGTTPNSQTHVVLNVVGDF